MQFKDEFENIWTITSEDGKYVLKSSCGRIYDKCVYTMDKDDYWEFYQFRMPEEIEIVQIHKKYLGGYSIIIKNQDVEVQIIKREDPYDVHILTCKSIL